MNASSSGGRYNNNSTATSTVTATSTDTPIEFFDNNLDRDYSLEHYDIDSLDRARRFLFESLSFPACTLFTTRIQPLTLTDYDLDDCLIAGGGYTDTVIQYIQQLEQSKIKFKSFHLLIINIAQLRQSDQLRRYFNRLQNNNNANSDINTDNQYQLRFSNGILSIDELLLAVLNNHDLGSVDPACPVVDVLKQISIEKSKSNPIVPYKNLDLLVTDIQNTSLEMKKNDISIALSRCRFYNQSNPAITSNQLNLLLSAVDFSLYFFLRHLRTLTDCCQLNSLTIDSFQHLLILIQLIHQQLKYESITVESNNNDNTNQFDLIQSIENVRQQVKSSSSAAAPQQIVQSSHKLTTTSSSSSSANNSNSNIPQSPIKSSSTTNNSTNDRSLHSPTSHTRVINDLSSPTKLTKQQLEERRNIILSALQPPGCTIFSRSPVGELQFTDSDLDLIVTLSGGDLKLSLRILQRLQFRHIKCLNISSLLHTIKLHKQDTMRDCVVSALQRPACAHLFITNNTKQPVVIEDTDLDSLLNSANMNYRHCCNAIIGLGRGQLRVSTVTELCAAISNYISLSHSSNSRNSLSSSSSSPKRSPMNSLLAQRRDSFSSSRGHSVSTRSIDLPSIPEKDKNNNTATIATAATSPKPNNNSNRSINTHSNNTATATATATATSSHSSLNKFPRDKLRISALVHQDSDNIPSRSKSSTTNNNFNNGQLTPSNNSTPRPGFDNNNNSPSNRPQLSPNNPLTEIPDQLV